MNQKRTCRALTLLFALVLLAITVCVTFAMAAHAGCCVQECDLCLGIAKLQENLRMFDVMLGALTGFLALLTLSQLALGELLIKQSTSSLVALKTRLNN